MVSERHNKLILFSAVSAKGLRSLVICIEACALQENSGSWTVLQILMLHN